jgi:hypothetical protein
MSKGEKNSKTKLVSVFGISKISILQPGNEISDRGRKSICFTDMFPSIPKGEIFGIIDCVFSLLET